MKKQITPPEQLAFFPSIDGNQIVYQALNVNDKNFGIYVYNLDNGSNNLITTNSTKNIGKTPDISGNTIVWAELGYYGYATYDELIVSPTNPVPSSSPSGLPLVGDKHEGGEARSIVYLKNHISPRISGDLIVYSHEITPGNNDVDVYNLANDTETVIANTTADEIYPDISGNRIVWQQKDSNGIYQIWTGLTDGTGKRQLTSDNKNKSHLRIDGSLIVYNYEITPGNNDVDVYNLANNTETVIANTTDEIANTTDDYIDPDPDISGNRIVWQQKDSNGISQIWTALSSGTDKRQITSGGSNSEFPSVSNNTVVWTQLDTGSGALYTDTLTTTSTPNTTGSNQVYRFYNPVSKGHFFTINTSERDTVIANPSWGYNFEGVGFNASSSPGDNLKEVYRFYNPVSRGHFFTINTSERDTVRNNLSSGYIYEEVGFYAYGASDNIGKDIYRFYNPISRGHFFTVNTSERDSVLSNSSLGYIYEGVGFEAIA